MASEPTVWADFMGCLTMFRTKRMLSVRYAVDEFLNPISNPVKLSCLLSPHRQRKAGQHHCLMNDGSRPPCSHSYDRVVGGDRALA